MCVCRLFNVQALQGSREGCTDEMVAENVVQNYGTDTENMVKKNRRLANVSCPETALPPPEPRLRTQGTQPNGERVWVAHDVPLAPCVSFDLLLSAKIGMVGYE